MVSILGQEVIGVYDIQEQSDIVIIKARDPVITYGWIIELVHVFGDHNLVIDSNVINGFVHHVSSEHYMSMNLVEIVYWKSKEIK